MKIALIQMNAGLDKYDNIAKAVMLVKRAIIKKAEFILLPEMFVLGGKLTKESLLNAAEKIPGPITKIFMDLARQNKVYILLGSIPEKINQTSKVYNASILLDDCGHVLGVYRKKHLFQAVIGKHKMDESKYFLPGKQLVLKKVHDFNVGLSICFDVRFPIMYQGYKKKEADILCIPSAFTQTTGQAHWETLLRARAIENLCYVVAPNQAGVDHKGGRLYGHSMIVSPWGEILARASGHKEEIIYASMDKKYIRNKRKLLLAVMKEE
jgi:nitrilase